ncbi:MAG: porphobilinogen synthase [Clostridiales bacterium]|nr:porphobilinogen synthase [Clostridiales bacterium]MCD7828475.1 porphobilinogen synthase [Clostridiales bacterium]
MKRFRKLRQNEKMRSFVRENKISTDDLIYPIFVKDGESIKEPIESMPGIFRYSIDMLDEILNEIITNKIQSILIFGIPSKKDEKGSGAYDENGVTQKAIGHIKKKYPNILIIADVCLCEYTSHGHCGIVKNGEILNDETLPFLSKTAVSLAEAGADIIAPSDMMDGRVEVIRDALDENGFINIPIMSYSAKFASAYYGPFREAAGSSPCFGDRKSYQMDPANGREAMAEIKQDLAEGADMIIIKPSLAYGDILLSARKECEVPLIAYNVSGEYAMVKFAAEKGFINEKQIVLENMLSLKRAGADRIITYHALDIARWLNE